ncbi:putative rab escort protein [Kockovaella imperatae]|uniref:Rab proteins geranylgeranyltransferase n=1 Tax=Kockovaella imperatae TaxID=4999 RepID=A0A1Y1U841_9TREE|nr:putative rab escort protein [Kockovaella imperatae]ORX33686.1 putative rab escort protein [Kockovaella imperatae]
MAQGLDSDEYDVVVLGTGLAESIAAAALAKAGKSVLHLDPNEYYGSAQASLTLDELIEYVKVCGSTHPVELPEKLEKDRRRYALSLFPAVLPSRGALIETLIASDVSKYVSFKMLDSVIVASSGGFRRVPGSKEQIFRDQSVSLMEKRKLMRFLMLSAGDHESSELIQGKENDALLDFLTESIKLPPDLASTVTYAIAHCSGPSDPLGPAIKRTQRYLQSVGRYGSGAFLVGQYGGAGEVAQGFCRACAVYGGTYVLGPSARMTDLHVDDKVTFSIPCHPRPVIAKRIISAPDLLAPLLKEPGPSERVLGAHCIAILSSLPAALAKDRALGEENDNEGIEQDDTAMIIFPPVDGKPVVRGLLMGEGTGSCPAGQYVLYISATVTEPSDSEELLRPYLRRLAPEPIFESYHVSETAKPSSVAGSSCVVGLSPYGDNQLETEALDWEAEQGRAAYEAIMGTSEGVRGFFEKTEGETEEETV